MADLHYLVGKIRVVLTSPNVDLTTISAKRVRKQLVAEGESEAFLRERKEEVDGLIAQIYEEVNTANGYLAANGAGGNGVRVDSKHDSPSPQKRRRSPEPSPAWNGQSSQPQPLDKQVKKVKPAPAKLIESDEQLARQLSLELNGGRNTRAGVSGNGSGRGASKGGDKKKVKKPKSKAIIDSDGEGGESGDDRPKKKARGGFGKEYVLSDGLAELAGATSLSRPQAVKKLWDHIKANKLQDPKDKREILCDDKLKAVFRVDRLNMFTMNKLLGDHLLHPDETI